MQSKLCPVHKKQMQVIDHKFQPKDLDGNPGIPVYGLQCCPEPGCPIKFDPLSKTFKALVGDDVLGPFAPDSKII